MQVTYSCKLLDQSLQGELHLTRLEQSLSPAGEMAEERVMCVYSDLDGTIIHYPSSVDSSVSTCQEATEDGDELIRLPPTHSGAVGVISWPTLRMFAALRALGVKLVLISGARSSSLLQRLPWLPAADAYVCESGGRIFYPDSFNPTAVPIREDLEWRVQHEKAAGPVGQDAVPPAQRAGTLWTHFAALQAAGGWALDAASYTTAFRLRPAKGGSRGAEDLAALRASVPEGLGCAGNLGALDFFPVGCGKENAAAHIMARFGLTPQQCVLMCDDDNDLGLAAAVAKAYVPGITAPSVAAAVEASPVHFYVSKDKGWRGTEEILRRLLQEQLGD